MTERETARAGPADPPTPAGTPAPSSAGGPVVSPDPPADIVTWPVDAVAYRDVGGLLAYPRNSRRHPPDQIDALVKSIRSFGFLTPLLVDGEGQVIAGAGRLQAAAELGMGQVPCIRIDHLTPEARRAFLIADNKIGELSDWDDGVLASELAVLQEYGWDPQALGFSEVELAELFPAWHGDDAGDAGDASEPKSDTVTLSVTLHKDQKPDVLAALDRAAELGGFHGTKNRSARGNALTKICREWAAKKRPRRRRSAPSSSNGETPPKN